MGEQRNRGFELTAFGELRPDLRLLGGFTYLDSKLTRTQGGRFDGKDAVGVPELTAVLNLEYDTPVLPRPDIDGPRRACEQPVCQDGQQPRKYPPTSFTALARVISRRWATRHSPCA